LVWHCPHPHRWESRRVAVTAAVKFCPPEGVDCPALNFDYQPFYRRRRWPTMVGAQTSTMHLDVTVDELDAAVA